MGELSNRLKLNGRIIARVIDAQTFEIKQESINHNIVTNEGDALIADLLSETPTRTKINNANGVMGVGTGFSVAAKTTDALVTQTGPFEPLDLNYPQTKGAFGATDDNIVQYRCTWEVGDLNDTGIDEVILKNGSSGDTLAYAEISPAIDVGITEILQLTWEITILGS